MYNIIRVINSSASHHAVHLDDDDGRLVFLRFRSVEKSVVRVYYNILVNIGIPVGHFDYKK